MIKLSNRLTEVHDCFTIAELIAYEDLGFAEPGKGREIVENKDNYHDGRLPINCDGGLKSKGHPLGATGISMTYEILKQMRGEAENIATDCRWKYRTCS